MTSVYYPSRLITRSHSGCRRGLIVLLAGVLGLACAATAGAAETSPADSKWCVRGRVIGIIPDDTSSNIQLEAGAARVPLSAGVGVDAAVLPELDVTCMITPHSGPARRGSNPSAA